MKLEGRTALVTGGGRGIGQAIAVAFAKEGADVIVASRTEDQLKETVQLIESTGRKGFAIPVDLSNNESISEFTAKVLTHFQGLDILVNNAASGSGINAKLLIDFDDNFWNTTLALNLTAPYLLSKAFLPNMIKAGWGRIINISSIAGKTGMPTGVAYCAAKHGLIGLTRTAALETAATGVTVNAICPGATRTSMWEKRMQASAEIYNTPVDILKKNINPMKYIIEPEEVAALAVFLAGNTGNGITGQSYNICGGSVMH